MDILFDYAFKISVFIMICILSSNILTYSAVDCYIDRVATEIAFSGRIEHERIAATVADMADVEEESVAIDFSDNLKEGNTLTRGEVFSVSVNVNKGLTVFDQDLKYMMIFRKAGVSENISKGYGLGL